MGYRTNVSIGFLFKDTEAMMAFAASVRLTGDKYALAALKEYRVMRELNLMHATWQNVKWYALYPDVVAHMDMLAKANELGVPNVFVYVGEEHANNVFELNHYDEPDAYDTLMKCFQQERSIRHPTDGDFIFNGGET